MPYLGNQHIVGDSVNNFKVLDDISSFTATFDGSSADVVSTANETIKVLNHRFVNGQRVTYNNGGGSNIGGLSSGTAYYVIYDTAHTIKLATSASNAASLTAINLSGVGGGTSHTLNVAFDGVNTKFRITHSSGNRPRFHHATQLSIAINNVIQKPNNDLNFTEGYAVEVRDTIVFKTAPTVNDIFFGSLTGETRGTFDITDHKIDRFTADGTTTLYTLTQNVPNNESLLVTLNGVVQHPTTGGVSGSYSIVSGTTNKLQFTVAPALGVDIQIRHLGFAGASSGDVSGFYGRTGNVGLTADDHITTGDLTSRNINASGIITASSFVGSGANLTGIDATAVKDSGGNVKIQAQASGAVYTGIHTFTGNVSVAGVSTFTETVKFDKIGDSISMADSLVHTGNSGTKLQFHVNAAELHTSGSQRLQINSGGNLIFRSPNNNTGEQPASLRWINENNAGDMGKISLIREAVSQAPGALAFYTSPNVDTSANSGRGDITERLRIASTGNVTIHKDLDVDGHTNLDNVSIAGVTTFAGNVNSSGNVTISNTTPTLTFSDTDHNPDFQIKVNTGHFYFVDATNNQTRFYITPDGGTNFQGTLNVGAGVTIETNGQATYTGIVTATSFVGSGTNGIKLPIGTTGQRVNTKGTLRYNSTLELPEYYNGTEWIAIDSPPTVTSVSPTEVATASGGNITFTINGSRFSVGVTIKFVSSNGTELTPSSVTRVNGNQLTAVIAKNSFVNAQEPYDVKVVNPSGLSAILADQINVDNDPAWVTSAGSLGSFNNYASVNVTVSATDADGDTVTYSIVSGSLPSGLSLNSSTGVISGTMGAVGSSTTVNFTIRATANGKTADRAFSFVQAGPNTVAYSYTGSAQTFSVPSGLSSLTAYVWGAGGGGGGQHTGAGGRGQAAGAGGYAKAVINLSGLSTLYLVVGQGGQSGQVANNSNNVGGGCGGGLSGIFDDSNTGHGDAILIAGAGGGGSGDSNGQAGEGGGGGGANNNGRDGIPDERINQRTQGLGGTTSAGGAAANANNSAGYTHTNPTAGSALTGGNSGSQASGQSLRPSSYLGGGRSYIATNGNWMGGGGGSGYYGGGGGICGYAGGGGGGSGYAKGSVCSSVVGTTGSDGSQQSQTAAPENSSTYYASGIAQGGAPSTDGGNGRIVLVY